MEPPLPGTLALAKLLYDMGFNMWEKEQVSDGQHLLDVAERVLEEVRHDPDDSLRADMHAIQGMFADSAGSEERIESLERRREAMEIRKKVRRQMKDSVDSYTTEDILLMNAVNDYAYGLLQRNQFSEAEKLFEQCIKSYRRWGTEDRIPYEYGKYYRNIGTVRMYQDRHDEAVAYTQKALNLTYAAMGSVEKTPRELRDKYMFACVLLQAGKLEDSYALHRRTLQERSSLFGEFNAITLESYYAMGAVCDCLGKLDEAR